MTSHDLGPQWGWVITGPDGKERLAQDDTADLHLLGLGQAYLLAIPGSGAYLEWMGSLMYPTVFHPKAWLLEFQVPCEKVLPNPIPPVDRRRIGPPALPANPAFPHAGSQNSAPPAHNSHAVDGPLGNR